MSTVSSHTDVIELLEADHHQAEQLLGRYETTSAEGRAGYFCEVVHALVAHEVAEEMAVYPALRNDVPGGDTEADARIAEQSEAESQLKKMESMDPASSEFDTSFRNLRQAVLSHAHAEESGAFRLLAQSEDAETRAQLGQRYEKAKRAAPTHPHPHAPDSPPGNVVLGPIAALFDRVRDAITKI